jgi:glucose/arabinose dehydrogenase
VCNSGSRFPGIVTIIEDVRRGILLRVLGLLALACDGRSAPPVPAPQPVPGVEQVTGSERVGWEQPASTAAELATFRFVAYIDGDTGVDLQDVRCGSTPGPQGFSCDARLPAMSAGAHTLTLASYTNGSSRLESGRSEALSLFVVGRLTAGQAMPGQTVNLTTTDGVELRADLIALGLNDPTDLAALPDGRLLIAERAGTVRIVAANVLQTLPAASIDDVVAVGDQGLLALEVDPEFSRSGFVYAAYTAADGLRLARLRAFGNRLQERVVLMDAVARTARHPAATLRFGPDARLYFGVDDGDQPRAPGDLGTFNGKVLRLNPDATTPSDQGGATPVYAMHIRSPRGVDWSPGGRAMWVLDATGDGGSASEGVVSLLSTRTGAAGRVAITARYALPPDTQPRDLVLYDGAAIAPFEGDLFIADDGESSILRLRVEPADPSAETGAVAASHRIVATERLLAGRLAGARALTVGPDGALYLATSDALIRLAPSAQR